MARRTRTALVLAVLAGLFLMHGMTAAEAGGCHGSVAMPAENSMPIATETTVAPERAMPNASGMTMAPEQAMPGAAGAMALRPGRTVRASQAAPARIAEAALARVAERAAATETCVPLRPKALAGWFLALLLIVIRRPVVADAIRPHWPHGPPRPGAALLIAFGVSRT